MKRVVFVLIFIFVFSLFCQDNYQMWSHLRNSAVTAEDSIYIRCETINTPMNSNEFLYFNDENFWQSKELQPMEGITYQSSFPYSSENTTYCRFKAETDTLVMMMPAFLSENSIPEQIGLLGHIAQDSLGDNLEADVPELDISNSFIGFSDEKLMIGIQNEYGVYPTDDGSLFPSEYYFYIGGLINPETAVQDTVMYGIVYANIPMFVGAGLYRVMGAEFNPESIQQIGEIEYDIVDGVLVLSCNWDDLINDEYFGSWPSITNSLAFQTITNRVNLSMDFGIADMSKPSIQNFTHYEIDPFENILPTLTDLNLEQIGNDYLFHVNYMDEHFPLVAEIEVALENGNTEIFNLLPASFDYSGPVQFSTQFNVNNIENITARFSDNSIDFVEEFYTPMDVEPFLINQSGINLSNYPNPFNPETTIQYCLPKDSKVKIHIFNLRGQLIETIVNGNQKKGNHSVVWNADHSSSGFYFYQLTVNNRVLEVNKCLLIK